MKVFWKSVSFGLMVYGMYYLVRYLFENQWFISAWILGLFFGFTLGVFPYKNYFRKE